MFFAFDFDIYTKKYVKQMREYVNELERRIDFWQKILDADFQKEDAVLYQNAMDRADEWEEKLRQRVRSRIRNGAGITEDNESPKY